MKWLQAIQQKLPKHKYAIDAKMLGDNAECAWSNLGYWDEATSSYPQACQQLAERLAQAVQLNQHDRVLDLGCGQGASLKYWLE
ncbi:SAM-dependent methyltransferase, partial [Acinetobacter baumannii]